MSWLFGSFRKAHLLPKKPFEMVCIVLPNHSCRFPINFVSPSQLVDFQNSLEDLHYMLQISKGENHVLIPWLQLLDLSSSAPAMAPKVPPLARFPQGSAEASTRGASDLDI